MRCSRRHVSVGPVRRFENHDLYEPGALDGFDVIFASGVIDVMPDPDRALDIFLGSSARWAIVHRQQIDERGSTRQDGAGYRGQRTYRSIRHTGATERDRNTARAARRRNDTGRRRHLLVRISSRRLLTLVSIPKPFVGLIATIQRNALRSWAALTGRRDLARRQRRRHCGSGRRIWSEACTRRGEERSRNTVTGYLHLPLLRVHSDRRHPLLRKRGHHPARRLRVRARTAFAPIEGQLTDDRTNASISVVTGGTGTRSARSAGISLLSAHDGGPPARRNGDRLLRLHRRGCSIRCRHYRRPSRLRQLARLARSFSEAPVIDARKAVVAVHQHHDYTHVGRPRRGAPRERGRQNRALAGGTRPDVHDSRRDSPTGPRIGGVGRNFRLGPTRPRDAQEGDVEDQTAGW